jgi:hypothetical protein
MAETTKDARCEKANKSMKYNVPEAIELKPPVMSLGFGMNEPRTVTKVW